MNVLVFQLLGGVQLSAMTLWTAARQPSSFTIPQSCSNSSFESVMPSDQLVPFRPLLLSSVFPSSKFFSSELALHIRWPKYWSFSISSSNEYSQLISLRIDWFDLLAVQGILRVFFSTTVGKHQFFGAQLSL